MAAWFWASALALLLLALWLVPLALWRRPVHSVAPGSANSSNLAVLRAQRRQLDEELAQGGMDAAQHRALRTEIERRVLEEEGITSTPQRSGSTRGTMWLLLVAMPVLALGLYALVGTPAALAPAAPQAAAGELSMQQVEAMVAKLADRMRQQPPGNVDDTEGWVMLGRGYTWLQRYPEAGEAFARAQQLSPNDAGILVDRADVLAMQLGGQLQGEPLQLIEQALKVEPSNLKALALAGTAAFERGDHAAAIGYWSRARAVVPADSELAQGLERSLAEAQAAVAARGAGGAIAAAATPPVTASATPPATPPATASATTPVTTAAAASGAATPGATSLSGRVRLAPALAAHVAPGDTLFVYARAVDGPRMPLAILKRSAADLPLEFKLDDAMAMSPELKLSSFANVVIGARLSKSGDAMPQSGDLEGQSPPLAGRHSGIDVLIDRVRP